MTPPPPPARPPPAASRAGAVVRGRADDGGGGQRRGRRPPLPADVADVDALWAHLMAAAFADGRTGEELGEPYAGVELVRQPHGPVGPDGISFSVAAPSQQQFISLRLLSHDEAMHARIIDAKIHPPEVTGAILGAQFAAQFGAQFSPPSVSSAAAGVWRLVHAQRRARVEQRDLGDAHLARARADRPVRREALSARRDFVRLQPAGTGPYFGQPQRRQPAALRDRDDGGTDRLRPAAPRRTERARARVPSEGDG